MSAKTHVTLYSEVVTITGIYLGPAADRFITRQIQNHLHKEPSELSKQDLVKLIDWMQVAISMITEDQRVVEKYISQLRSLVKGTTVNNSKSV